MKLTILVYNSLIQSLTLSERFCYTSTDARVLHSAASARRAIACCVNNAYVYLNVLVPAFSSITGTVTKKT